jgi:hypothetical protein
MIGMRIRNNGNILQVDGNYQNMEVSAQGTATTSGSYGGTSEMYADIPIPSGRGNSLLAVYGATAAVYCKKQDANTFRVFSQASTPATFTYYLFSTPQAVSGGVGLKIRNNTTGAVLFNSRYKYLRVLDYLTGTLAIDSAISRQYPGKKVAIIQTLRPFHIKIDSGGTSQQPAGVFTFRSGQMTNPQSDTATVTFGISFVFGGPVQVTPVANGMNSIGYLVIDVTGY